MLAHVHGPLCLGKPEEAIDVLRTGVSASSSSKKLDEAALLLAWSDAEAARGGLAAAVERAALAREALIEAAEETKRSPLALYLRLLVEDARLRASLALSASSAEEVDGGGDEEILLDLVSSPASSSSSAVAAASAAGMRALLAHSRGDAEVARREADTVSGALGRLEEAEENEEGEELESHAAAAFTLASLAASRAAAVHLACGESPAAIELYSKAVALAERARKSIGEGKDKLGELFSPLAAADAALAALCGRAQARSVAALPLLPPQDSQKDAGDALSSFDAEKGNVLHLQRPEVVASPLLLVLGALFASSGQPMVAEGLFRRGGQLLGILKQDKAKASPLRHAVHPSVAAALAWRHAQLLTALPRRSKEASELAEAAARIAESEESKKDSSSPLEESCRSSLEDSMGTLDALTGNGRRGKGVVVDAAARRVLPWLR